MGRRSTNRGRVDIQPIPIEDLKLQGYIPKTLYVPDDISLTVSIIAGKNGDTVRVPYVDDNGNLLVKNTYLYDTSEGVSVFRLIPQQIFTNTLIVNDLALPLASELVLTTYLSVISGGTSNVTLNIWYYDYTGSTIVTDTDTIVFGDNPHIHKIVFPGTNKTHNVTIRMDTVTADVSFNTWTDVALVTP